MKKVNKNKTIELLLNIAPVIGLIILVAAFLIIASIKDVNISYSFKNIINQRILFISNKASHHTQHYKVDVEIGKCS